MTLGHIASVPARRRVSHDTDRSGAREFGTRHRRPRGLTTRSHRRRPAKGPIGKHDLARHDVGDELHRRQANGLFGPRPIPTAPDIADELSELLTDRVPAAEQIYITAVQTVQIATSARDEAIAAVCFTEAQTVPGDLGIELISVGAAIGLPAWAVRHS
jgi:hypothetical protein